ncbi:MAG: sensor histidine kinase, partial [Ktedonobacteraceae bacterium]|nr:sensor histidine kinase [Ktedonobacteraceae bacterium]
QVEELQLLHIISDQIGLAMQRARLSAEHTRAAARLATIEERNRLAREIHDTLAQGLAAITLQLEAADALAASRPQRAQAAVQRALSLARSNLEEARRSVMDMRAAPLQGYTLPEALAMLVANGDQASEQSEAGTRIHYVYSPAPDFPTLPARIETSLYRIAQEALNNVRNHANARNVEMTLTATDQLIHLVIQDDGCGFDPDIVTQKSGQEHFGLTGINERVKLLNGTICIQSEPGAGTRLDVRVPY